MKHPFTEKSVSIINLEPSPLSFNPLAKYITIIEAVFDKVLSNYS